MDGRNIKCSSLLKVSYFYSFIQMTGISISISNQTMEFCTLINAIPVITLVTAVNVYIVLP
jgi:hypothetical protein